MNEPLEYTGKYQPNALEIEQQGIYPYLPSENLVEAVNLAIALHRPLVLEGEPGCGKTRLAEAVAYEFTQKYRHQPLKWPYYRWNISSKTQVQDGLYLYDTISQLRDLQLLGMDSNSLEQFFNPEELNQFIHRLKDPKSYRKWGPLGQALQQPDYRSIVLIDEIDQADLDFSRNLPLEFNQLRLEVQETGEVIESVTAPPVIIMTCNHTIPLSNHFFKHCLYFYVEFPDQDHLLEIIYQRFPNLKREQKRLIEDAVACCVEMREIIAEYPSGKKPGTREVIEFITALLQKPIKQARSHLENLCEQIPLLGILLKSKPEQNFYRDYEY